jgi:hypothetical protein
MDDSDHTVFACASLCLELDTMPPDTLSGPRCVSDRIDPERDLVTWLVEGSRFLVLAQTPRGTRIYDAQDDYLYYAAPYAQLSPACPPGHAFLCQTVQDSGEPPVPRLLVTDLVAPRIECPHARNAALRALAPLLPSVCHLQWAGKRDALERFVQGGGVPHRVAGIAALRAPLVLAREPSTTGIAALDALALPVC